LNGNGLNVSGESGRDCQIQGALACVDRFGKEGMAISFNRAKDIVSSGPLTGFPYGNCAKSVSGWFQADSAQYYYQCLFGIGKPGSQYNFQICEGPSNAGDDYEFRINGWGDQYDWRTGVKAAPYFNRTWHHAAVSYDGSKTVFYLDGKKMAQTDSYTYYTDPNSSSVIMGVEIDTLGWNLKGAIDDVRIYARALTDSDVNKIFNSRD
jgi:sialidase-1